MKTTLFTASLVMACLMLPGSGTALATTDFTATFHLKAKYQKVTCNNTLKTSGDINGTEIDFGTFSYDSAEKQKSVVLTLECDSDLPDKVKFSFSVSALATVDGSITNRLYPSPSAPGESAQKILYYDWVWGEGIDNTVKSSGVNGAHTALHSGDKIDLTGKAGDVYEVVPERNEAYELTFPLKITRKVNKAEISNLAAGDYTAAVTVKVSYE